MTSLLRMLIGVTLLIPAAPFAPPLARPATATGSMDDSTVFRGRVVSKADATPVSGAEVSFPSLGRSTSTDTSGAFRLAGLPAGLQAITVRKVGFAVRQDTVTILARGETVRIYEMTPQATPLDTVRTVAGKEQYISPTLRAFEERRLSHSGGYFISDSVFRRNENATLADIISSRTSGLTTAYFNSAKVLISTRKMCRGLAFQNHCNNKPDCFVAIYVDGSLYYNAKMADQGMMPPDMEKDFNPSSFAGAEYYPGGASMPIGMHPDDDGCGSLWLWTREK